MIKKFFIFIIIFFLFSALSSKTWAILPIPTRIGGTLTIINVTQIITNEENKDENSPPSLPNEGSRGVSFPPSITGTQIMTEDDDGYEFVVTRSNDTLFEPKAEDKDGLNNSNCYIIDVPIYEADDQPSGAHPGDVAVIHVYKDGKELNIISPPYGRFIVEHSTYTRRIDLVVQNISPPLKYHEEPKPYDINNDNKTGLEEIIYILQMIAGIRQ